MTSLIRFRKALKFPVKRFGQDAVKVSDKVQDLLFQVVGGGKVTPFEQTPH